MLRKYATGKVLDEDKPGRKEAVAQEWTEKDSKELKEENQK